MEKIEQLEVQVNSIGHDVNQMRQELHNVTIMLNESNKKVEEYNKKLEESTKKLEESNKKREEFETRMITLLEGDSLDPKRGIVPRVISLEEFINSIKNVRTYLSGSMAGSLFIIGAIGTIIGFAYKVYLFFTAK